jgi:hypothetical protein
VSDERGNDDRVERVLSTQQWRVLGSLLDESAIPADPILDEGDPLGTEEHLTVCYELHHVLLPELVDMRLVEFDRFEDEIQRGPRFDEVRPFLDRIDGNHDERLGPITDSC